MLLQFRRRDRHRSGILSGGGLLPLLETGIRRSSFRHIARIPGAPPRTPGHGRRFPGMLCPLHLSDLGSAIRSRDISPSLPAARAMLLRLVAQQQQVQRHPLTATSAKPPPTPSSSSDSDDAQRRLVGTKAIAGHGVYTGGGSGQKQVLSQPGGLRKMGPGPTADSNSSSQPLTAATSDSA